MVYIRLIEHDICIYMTTTEYNILQLKTALSNNIKKNKGGTGTTKYQDIAELSSALHQKLTDILIVRDRT